MAQRTTRIVIVALLLATIVLSAVPAVSAQSPTRVPAAQTYIVVSGDTLSRIAARYGVTVQAIAAANGIADPSRIRVGQVLKIP